MKILHRGYILNRQQLEAIAPAVLAYAMGQIKVEDFEDVADRAMANAGCPVPKKPSRRQLMIEKGWPNIREKLQGACK